MTIDLCIQECELRLGPFTTKANLHVIPLRSYRVVLGMDWLQECESNIECRNKTIYYIEDFGEHRVIVGIQRPISLRMISAMQLE